MTRLDRQEDEGEKGKFPVSGTHRKRDTQRIVANVSTTVDELFCLHFSSRVCLRLCFEVWLFATSLHSFKAPSGHMFTLDSQAQSVQG